MGDAAAYDRAQQDDGLRQNGEEVGQQVLGPHQLTRFVGEHGRVAVPLAFFVVGNGVEGNAHSHHNGVGGPEVGHTGDQAEHQGEHNQQAEGTVRHIQFFPQKSDHFASSLDI